MALTAPPLLLCYRPKERIAARAQVASIREHYARAQHRKLCPDPYIKYPLSRRQSACRRARSGNVSQRPGLDAEQPIAIDAAVEIRVCERSEERRVGKVCRS